MTSQFADLLRLGYSVVESMFLSLSFSFTNNLDNQNAAQCTTNLGTDVSNHCYADVRNSAHATPQNYPPQIPLASYNQCFLINAKIMSTAMLVHYQKEFDGMLNSCVDYLCTHLIGLTHAQRAALSTSLFLY